MSDQGGTSAPEVDQGQTETVVKPMTQGPMTKGLMARLFVVPAIIVSVLLAVSVIVVLFGASSLTATRSIDELLDVLESGSGQRQYAAILLPAEKEYWQAAQELSSRLAKSEGGRSPIDIEATAARLISIVNRYAPGRDHSNAGTNAQHFLMLSLARLGSASGVEPLVGFLNDPDRRTRRVALQALAEMGSIPAARQALSEVLRCLDDPESEVRLVACVAVASLADRGNAVAIRAVADKLESDREMQWNAAMTLARLGSAEGKLILMNLLDRAFWNGIKVSYDADGASVSRPFTAVEVSRNLVAAVDAASQIDDGELTALIEELRSDESHAVRDAASSALDRAALEEKASGEA